MIPGAPVRLVSLRARLEVAARPLSCREACERLGRGLPDRDRGLLLQLVAGATRHLLTLDHLLSRHSRRRLDRLESPVLEALRLGAFQLAFCERIPPHAALDTTVEALKTLRPKGASTVNAVLRALAAEIEGHGDATKEDDPVRSLPDGTGRTCRFRVPVLPEGDPSSPSLLSIRSSLPAWLCVRWILNFGPLEAERIAFLALSPPPLVLRPNPLRTLPEALLKRVVPLPGGALHVPEGGDPAGLPGWKEGAFSVQDASAQAVVSEGVRPAPGERVLDLCAGVGGKACAMAERGASVTAVDLSGRRLEKLRVNAERLGLSIETRTLDALSLPPEWTGAFDAVLLDAPCTNTGVLRRRPEARWRLTAEDPARMADLQKRLLEAAAGCVKPGGRLVYSTCSLEPEENTGAGRLTMPSALSDGGFWVRS